MSELRLVAKKIFFRNCQDDLLVASSSLRSFSNLQIRDGVPATQFSCNDPVVADLKDAEHLLTLAATNYLESSQMSPDIN